jgi:hypothetical protein
MTGLKTPENALKTHARFSRFRGLGLYPRFAEFLDNVPPTVRNHAGNEICVFIMPVCVCAHIGVIPLFRIIKRLANNNALVINRSCVSPNFMQKILFSHCHSSFRFGATNFPLWHLIDSQVQNLFLKFLHFLAEHGNLFM